MLEQGFEMLLFDVARRNIDNFPATENKNESNPSVIVRKILFVKNITTELY